MADKNPYKKSPLRQSLIATVDRKPTQQLNNSQSTNNDFVEYKSSGAVKRSSKLGVKSPLVKDTKLGSQNVSYRTNESSSSFSLAGSESFVESKSDRIVRVDDDTFIVDTATDIYINNYQQNINQNYITPIAVSGYSGFSGTQGLQGLSGFSGATGISGFSGATGTTLTQIPYDVMFAFYDRVAIGTIIGSALMIRPTVFTTSSASLSLAYVQTTSTAVATFTIQKYVPSSDTISVIGSIMFNPGQRTGTVTLTETSFARGDALQIKTDTLDTTLFGFMATLVAFYTL